MSIVTVNTFAQLRARFPTWEELKTHVESPAGGRLRIIESPEHPEYAVLRYVKGQSDLQNPTLNVGQFRSVVWCKEANIPVCVAPFKAREGLPPTDVTLQVNQFVDGFMVNVFKDGDSLQLATRTQLGGGNTFYSEKTFGQMFDDALATTATKTRAELADCLGERQFASFVVQHPQHRIVARIMRPSLQLVYIGTVVNDGTLRIESHAPAWPAALRRLVIPAAEKIYYDEAEMEDTMRRMAVQEGWRWQGLCFRDGAGNRWRIRSPTYTMLRELRGAEAKSLDRFLRLRGERKVGEYLRHYTEDRAEFAQFENQLRAVTGGVLAAYADCHKAHTIAFKDLPDAVRPAVYVLHLKWLETLRPKGFSVRLQNAVEVVNALRPFEQRRLVEAGPYISAAPAPAPAAPTHEEPVDIQEVQTEEVVE